ncbi:MAG TPA: hypothetical protein VJS92_17610 [Candidatus Polarisedimenticolaceae bacterium]|nr:hypothetical protein [Candidatus Polarisedimenticolaceae bacterium]
MAATRLHVSDLVVDKKPATLDSDRPDSPQLALVSLAAMARAAVYTMRAASRELGLLCSSTNEDAEPLAFWRDHLRDDADELQSARRDAVLWFAPAMDDEERRA